MPNALVTGIGGQDGYYMARLLSEKGYRVTGTLRPGSSPPALDVPTLEVDMRDGPAIARAVRVAEPDEVYNFAGVSSLAEADVDPVSTYDINATGVERLLEHLPSDARLCQASSSLIFGPPDGSARDETTALAPQGPYAEAKADAHRAIGRARGEGRYAVSAILFNHESPMRSTRFVSRKVTQGVAEISLGRRAKLGVDNLGAVRDWGYAGDYIRAMWMSLQHGEPMDLVIATGKSHSVRDLVRLAFETIGIDRWEDLVEAVRDEPEPWSAGDASRAREALGWAPEVGFKELVRIMVRHDLDNV